MNNNLFTLLIRLIKEIKMAVKKADVVMNIKHLLEDLKDEMVAYSSLPMADLKQLQNALLDARETIQDRYYKKNGTRAESRLRPIAFYRKNETTVTRIDSHSIIRDGEQYKLFNHLLDKVETPNMSGNYRLKDSTGGVITLTPKTLEAIYHYNHVVGDGNLPFYKMKR